MDIAYNYVVQPDKVVDLFNKFGAVNVETIENTYLKQGCGMRREINQQILGY